MYFVFEYISSVFYTALFTWSFYSVEARPLNQIRFILIALDFVSNLFFMKVFILKPTIWKLSKNVFCYFNCLICIAFWGPNVAKRKYSTENQALFCVFISHADRPQPVLVVSNERTFICVCHLCFCLLACFFVLSLFVVIPPYYGE